MLKVQLIPVLESNFVQIAQCTQTGEVAIIDAPPGNETIAFLTEHGLTPSKIIITHYDWDHIDGIKPLKDKYNIDAFGPAEEAAKIPELTKLVNPGDKIAFGNGHFKTIDTSGHTFGHVSYFYEPDPVLFAGDALFSLGCGYMVAGPAEKMWGGLKRLRELPDETRLYCGHEYTLANAAFALSLDPDNEFLKRRAKEAKALRAANKPTLPSNLGMEKKTNPFLRADDPLMAEKTATIGQPAYKTFAALREAKNKFNPK